ncbi:MAG: PAS domain S-box protein [Thermoleophilia bacterium]|nr:PAS domain S-box protein [Thermoleophilia bacterium]
MAKSAAWLYWLGIIVVLIGVFLPVEQEMNLTPVMLLVAGGLLSSLVLMLAPWQRFSYKLFYIMAGLGCSHIATLIFVTGGMESPYSQLYFLIAIWAAYFFSFRGFGLVSVMVIGSLAMPFLYERGYGQFHITHVLTQILFMLIAGGLVNLLVTQVKERNLDLGRTNERLAQKMREVLHEKEKTAAVLSSVADGVYVVDNNDKIVLWNQAAELITGFTKEEMVGRVCRDAMKPAEEGGNPICTPLCDTMVEFEPGSSGVGYELLTCRKNGDRIWLSVSAAPIRDSGETAGIVHVFRDISEYKEIDRMKSDFVATVSHELRTPLTSILGFAKTLLRADANFSEESRESFLTEIVREGERLARLIEDVLSVSRIEAGSLRLDLRPVAVEPTVREVVRNVSSLTSIHRFEINVPDDISLVMADSDKLHQVLLNLVVNAVKYSPDGGEVSVSAAESEGYIRFLVADQGVGISEENLPHIFERFFRASPGGKRGAAGTGLGLYVSRNLIEQMGGEIWAESQPGAGSRFYFRLPVAQADQAGAEPRKKVAS